MKSALLTASFLTLFAGANLVPAVANAQAVESAAPAQAEPYSRLDLNKFPKAGDKDDFLTLETAPDSLALLPAPPQPKTAAFNADVAAYKAGLELRKTARGELARLDADTSPEGIVHAFSDVLGVKISPETTPITYNLMWRMVGDLSDEAVDKAKARYKRIRPFMYFKTRSCQSEQDEARMRLNGSYPSGHTAFGWGFALILAEIAPEKQNAILKRGYDYGQSRVICGAHWQSDVDAGRVAGSATVAKLHTVPGFERQLSAARAEIANLAKQKAGQLH